MLKTAAAIASEFKIDPIVVLNSTRFEWQVRSAAFAHISEEKRKSAKKK